MIRSLRVAGHGDEGPHQAINALKALVVTAPELREQLRGLSTVSLVRAAARFEPGAVTTPMAAGKLARRFPDRGLRSKTRRHRLNRGGDRHANAALHRIVVTRLRHDRRTQDYRPADQGSRGRRPSAV